MSLILQQSILSEFYSRIRDCFVKVKDSTLLSNAFFSAAPFSPLVLARHLCPLVQARTPRDLSPKDFRQQSLEKSKGGSHTRAEVQ